MWLLCLAVCLVAVHAQTETDSGCGSPHVMGGESGVITSMNHPNNYDNNAACDWQIIVADGKTVSITFQDFDVESHSSCGYDFVAIWDGVDDTAPYIGSYCGSSPPPSLTSTGKSMWIRFRSDSSITRTGFKLTYQARAPSASALASDCYTGNSVDYRGTLAVTQSGKRCQRWDSQYPHSHRFSTSYYVTNYGLQENYCRNPDEDPGSAWCYTTDANTRWEYCDLTTCSGGTTTTQATTTTATTTTTAGSGTIDNPGDCGNPAIPALLSRVVGGVNAREGSWPWQVSMLLRGSHVCGGSIIAPNWIATAAHCVDSNRSPSSWTIRVGSHRRQSTDAHQRDHAVSSVIMHENYNSNLIDNDIALMKLSSSITYDDYASPACLPSVDVASGTECYTTGWGSTGGSGLPNILQQGKVPIVARDTCNERSYYNGEITDNMICAGYQQGGIDACQGDSGGPLVCNYGGAWTLDGIVSWGYGCAQAYKPGVYTRVTNYISWINNKMATN